MFAPVFKAIEDESNGAFCVSKGRKSTNMKLHKSNANIVVKKVDLPPFAVSKTNGAIIPPKRPDAIQKPLADVRHSVGNTSALYR